MIKSKPRITQTITVKPTVPTVPKIHLSCKGRKGIAAGFINEKGVFKGVNDATSEAIGAVFEYFYNNMDEFDEVGFSVGFEPYSEYELVLRRKEKE